jgi:heterotetrameric sarcosine oxidase gamma subunit
MDELADLVRPVRAAGFDVALYDAIHVASLRYFALDGEFGAAVLTTLGVALPATGRLARTADGKQLLAWIRPGEALLLTADADPGCRLESAVKTLDDGCIVDLTGGACVIRIVSPDSEKLLAQLGGLDIVPAAGEVRVGRVAEVRAVAVGIGDVETWLIVERAYMPHLMDWIRVSVLDLF